MVHMEKGARTKLDHKAKKCVLAENLSSGMYKLYDPETARFVWAQRARFDDKVFSARNIEDRHEYEQFEVLHDSSYQLDIHEELSDGGSSILTTLDTASE